MAVYKIFPEKDATIYSKYPVKNTGLDEILELTIDQSDTESPGVSRFLIQFSDSDIDNVYDNYVDGNYHKVFLRCYAADVTALPGTIDLSITTIADYIQNGWNMGTGRYNYNPEYTNGVGWKYAEYSGSALWPTTSAFYYEVQYGDNTPGGCVWYTSSLYKYTQTLSYYDSKDINVDVTNTVDAWWDNSIYRNQGFLVRINEDVYYYGADNAPSLKYYSRDTHTIYPPCLEVKWDDYSFNVDSNIDELTTLPAVISIDNNSGVFYPSSINQFRVNSRPEYPARVYQTSSYYTQNYYLPEDSCYAIKDLDTNEYVIDFDDTFTKLSVDDNGSYFTLYMNGLEPERYYSILIKTIINNSTIIFDADYNFKIVNG
jgi:hypothetical protein